VLRGITLTVKSGRVVALVRKQRIRKNHGHQSAVALLRSTARLGAHRADRHPATLPSRICIVRSPWSPRKTIRSTTPSAPQKSSSDRPGATDGKSKPRPGTPTAHEFIIQKPQGYESVVGDREMPCPAASRAAHCHRRAILRMRPILVLDEATSSLDTDPNGSCRRRAGRS